MNICGNNNSYNRSSHFRQVAGLVMRLNRNLITLDEVKKELQDTFVKIDADAIIDWINDNPGKPFPTDFAVSTIKVEASNSLLLKNNPFNGSISRYYGLFGGNAKKDAEDLQYKMNSTLVFELVYNPETKTIIHANAPSAYYGYTEINRRLRKLKESFAKDVATRFNLKVPNYNFDNDVEFTVFTNSIIRDALSALHTQNLVGHSIDKDTLDAFVKLAQFDELVLNSNIVTLNPGEESNGIFSKNRYSFTGEPVYSRSMYEEHADVKDYTSKLVTCILDSIKCAESATGKDVDIKIGLDGFNHAIHYVNDYFSKLTILSEDKSKYSYAKRIELYLRNSGQLTRNLRQILYGLQKNIFNEDVPQEIVDLFSAQAETTVRSSYVEYGFDNIKIDATEKNIPGITYRKVHDRMEDQAKINLASKLTSRMRYYQSLSQQERDAKRKNVAGFSILKKENGIIECVYNNDSNIRLSFTPIAKGYNIDKSNIRPEHNDIFARLINELVDVSILNSKEVGNELGSDQTLIDYFGQMLAVSCDALTGNFTKMMRQNKISFVAAFDFVSPAVGFMQRLTKNEIHTVTKDLHGNTIPSDQLVSFGYRIQELIDDIVKNKDHVQHDNLFITNRSAIKDISLRQSAEVGSVIRDVESMTFNEVEQLKVLYDFYQNLLKYNSVRLQSMTYSDKTRHLLYDIAVDKINIGDKNDFKKANELLKNLAKSFLFNGTKLNEDVIKAENLFIEQIKTVRAAQLEKSLISFVTRFSSALKMSVSGDLESQVNQIKERINNQPISWLREKFKLAGINLYEENDIIVNKKGNIIGINQATLDMYNTMTNTERAKNYFNYMKYQYLKTLKDKGFKLSSVYDPSLNSLYFSKLNNETSAQWINSQSGTMSLGFIKSKSGSILSEYDENDILTGNAIVELNPMFNSYFWAMNLFGEQLRSLTMGLDQNIAGGGSSFDEITHNKFIAHTKRAMGQGSTIMKFYPKKFGIAKEMDACVYDDVRAHTFNPKLDEKDELAFDGGGHISPFEFLMEQYSLPGNVNLRGDVMKSIVQCIDSNGALNQIKWAGTTLSNFRRRGCLYGNKLDLNVMFRKMHSRSISLNFKLDKYYGSNLFRSNNRIITCNEPLYFYDINSGKHYKILSVTNDPLNDINTATRTVIEVDSHGNIIKNAQPDSKPISINNISDLHELFGGIYCKTLNQVTKELEYSEINNEIVTNIICNQDLKNKFVAYAICKSAFKVGIHNVNDSSIFSHANNSDLWTIKLDLSHSGMQLDAGHEVSDGHVSEGSQMISLVTEAGYATDIVQELYEQIAKVTDEGLSKFNDESKIKSVLSKILDESLNSGTSDVVSITDDFIKHLKNKAKESGIELELYFSSPSIRSKFSTAVCACINRLALRRKFAGLGTVQTPSYDQMVTHRIGNYNMTSEDLADEYRESLNGNPISYLFADPNSTDSNIVSPEYIQNMLNITSKSDGISAIEQIEPYTGYVRNINFGDTIIYQDNNGNFVAVNIEDIKTYDALRHSQNVLYKWNTRPKNLIQQLSYFEVFDTINGGAYKITIYDFDEYRISAYLSEYLKNKSLSDYQLEFLKEKGISLDSNLSEIINSQQKLLQKKLSEIGNAIKSGNSFALSDGIFITGHENVGAEIMIGNPWLKQFNLRQSDSLFKILKGGESFFESRLKEFYSKVDGIPKTGYDAILYTSTGEPILIQFGSELQNSDRISNLRQGNSLTRIGNSILYDGEEMGSSIGFSDYEVQASGGKSFKVWRIADPSRLNNLLKKKMFDHVIYNMSTKTNLKQFLPLFYSKHIENGIVKVPIRIGNKIIYKDTRLDKNNIPSDVLNDIIEIFNKTQEDKFNSKLKDLAKQRAIAFKRLLTCIGTRIPSQALSSVAKCNIVGFTGSSSNDVYLPRVLTWVAGSDYKSIL